MSLGLVDRRLRQLGSATVVAGVEDELRQPGVGVDEVGAGVAVHGNVGGVGKRLVGKAEEPEGAC